MTSYRLNFTWAELLLIQADYNSLSDAVVSVPLTQISIFRHLWHHIVQGVHTKRFSLIPGFCDELNFSFGA